MALQIILDGIQPDIVVLSERKLNCNEISHAVVPNFNIESYFCQNTCGGGGIMILFRNSIKAKLITIPAVETLIVDKEFECCMVEVKLKQFSHRLIDIYKTPGSAFGKFF